MHVRLSPRLNSQDIRAWARSSSDIGFFILQLPDELLYILYWDPNYQLTPNQWFPNIFPKLSPNTCSHLALHNTSVFVFVSIAVYNSFAVAFCMSVRIWKEMFYLTTHNTFYSRLYGVGHMVEDHSDSERGNLLPPHGLLFPISSKGSFICTISQTG